ncbi:MAG TPA: hypothetical protein VFQ38_21115 [Longimicrobiales bacterium]|nr:hypothetical protein [Longimicrobiales bacterium]
MTRPPQRRRPRLNPLTSFVIIVGLILVTSVAGRWIALATDVVMNPWAHASRGKTLTGTWVAPVTMPSGVRAAVFVDLRRAIVHSGRYKGEYRGGRRSANIEGAWRWCDATGLVAGNEISGRMSGGELGLGFREPPGLAPGRTLVLTGSHGRWAPGDTLRVDASFSRKSPGGLTWSSADPDTGEPVPILFHRGDVTDFERACRALTPARPT